MTHTTSENTSVQVALRIRPLTAEDMVNLPSRFQKNVLSTSRFAPNQVTVLGEKKQTFTFDYVFGADASQKDLYDVAVKNMVDKFLEEEKGIIPRAISTLFSYINSAQYKNRKCTMKVSFVELYNEDLIDLLSEEEDLESKPQLMIREDSKGNIIWSGLQEIKVTSVDEVMGHLARGSLNRQVNFTDMNSQSSRSHAIFSVTLSQQKMVSSSSFTNNARDSPLPTSPTNYSSTSSNPPSRSGSRMSFSKNNEKGEWVSVTSKFHFVDLAGSERLKRTSAVGDRAKEGISINSGLLALGNVISALGDPSRAKNTTHVPYRDSKLTRLLQDSLGGNAQTLMIACATPAEYNISETINTLKYANRARNIKNVATVNQEEAGWHDLEHLQNLVLKLRNEIKALKQSVSISSNNPGSGRNTPILQPDGRDDSPPTPLTISTTNLHNKDKDIEALEIQISELQRSYAELSQKHAKTTAELYTYQDNLENSGYSSNGLTPIIEEETIYANVNNNGDNNKLFLNFQETVGPVIKEYEKSIADLESKLSLTRAALSTSEKLVQEHSIKLAEVEDLNHKNKNMITDLKNKIFKLHEREETTENYIKDLEAKVNSQDIEQKKDQEVITELKHKVYELQSNAEDSEGIIRKLEAKLLKTEQKSNNANVTLSQLEQFLQEKEEAYVSLEGRFNQEKSNDEKDTKLLLTEIEDRDKRIAELEKKVDELVNNISQLKHLKSDSSSSSSSPSSSLFSSSDIDTPLSTSSSLNTSISTSDYSSVSELESKLYELQKTHEDTVLEFQEIKDKYQGCLEELSELYTQLADAKMLHLNIVETTPSTPMTDTFDEPSNPNSLSPYTRGTHRKARSLSTEIKGAEKKELTSMAMIQKLQIELRQLELLHEDKAKGLDAVRQEFARLEINHLATIEIIEELREEIKRRDALAQLEVMSVMTSEYAYTDGGFSAATSEIDQIDIVHRLRDDVEQLKEEQRKTLDLLSKNDNKEEINNDEILKIESTILQLKSEMNQFIEERDQKFDKVNDEAINKLKSKIKEYDEQLIQAQEAQRQIQVNQVIANLEEIDKTTTTVTPESEQASELRQQVERIQNEIEAKSHTIAALLFPSVENQNTIRRLEDELQESRDVLRLAIEERNNRLETISEDDDDEYEIGDKHVKELESRVKDLEFQLTKAKEAQHVPTRRSSIADNMNQTYDTIEVLVRKLNELQHELLGEKSNLADHETELFTNLRKQVDMLKTEIVQKYELIDTLKRDLADKSTIQQRLREKESEALAFRTKLMEVHKHEEVLENEIRELKARLYQLENGEDVNKVLHAELETLRKELKEVHGREVVALERLRVLKAKMGTDNEESHLQEQLEHLRSVEIAQRERILVLEGILAEQGGKVDEDLIKLRTDLAFAKDSEITYKKTIESLENKLKKAEDRSQVALLKREISVIKNKEIEQLAKIQELELKSSQQTSKDGQRVKELNEEIEKLRANEREQRKQMETLEIRLELVQDEDPNISSLRDQISSLKASETDLKRNVQELESKLLSSQKEANIFETVKEEVKLLKEIETQQKSTIEQLQSQLRKVRNTKEAAIKELQTMKGGFSLQKELVISQEEELKVLRQELAITKEKNKTSLDEFESLSKSLNEIEKQRDDSQKKVKVLEIEIETYKIAGSGSDSNIKALREELSNTKLEMVAQNEILAELGSQLIEIEKSRDQNDKHVEELKKTLKEKEASQKDAIKSLENTLVTLETELSKYKNSSNVNKENITNIEGKLSVVKEQLQYAKDLDEKRSTMINDLESKLVKAVDALKEKDNDIVNQDNMLAELEKIILATQTELSSSRSSEIEESERIKQLQTKLNELTFKLSNHSSSAEIELIKNELSKSKTIEAEQNQIVKELEIKLKEAQSLRNKEISKLKDANKEIDELQEKCTNLQNKLEDTIHDSLIQSYENIDDSAVEDLANQLKKAHAQVVENRDRVVELEKSTKLLESEKSEQIERNENLEQHVEQLQKDIENLAEEFAEVANKFNDTDELSKQQKSRIVELEIALEEAKKKPTDNHNSALTNPALAKLASANELLRQTNENLNLKTAEAGEQIKALKEKIKTLEKEVINDSENNKLREKIKELQSERDELEEANENYFEERSKLDLKVESLLEQLRLVGLGGNHAATQITQLNEQVINLEKELSILEQKSSLESNEMENEITRLLEINEQLEHDVKDLGIDLSNPRSSISDTNSHSGAEDSAKNKIIKQEVLIAHQNNIIKTLKERITDLERNDNDNALSPRSRRGSDANTTAAELVSEIQKLHKKIAKLEGEGLQNRNLVESLETALKDEETELRVAKQQLSILQREKSDHMDEIRKLRTELDDAQLKVEEAKSTVQEEKKVMETVLEEERKAKERAEKARLALESRMEQLIAKRNKFMCF
ncbi:13413_t:CDS:2 [Entrophospora sp. SA101]|nr:13413_t:CDS:2 [Entrophospora sp. SA101]